MNVQHHRLRRRGSSQTGGDVADGIQIVLRVCGRARGQKLHQGRRQISEGLGMDLQTINIRFGHNLKIFIINDRGRRVCVRVCSGTRDMGQYKVGRMGPCRIPPNV